jgi:hypothetical protein
MLATAFAFIAFLLAFGKGSTLMLFTYIVTFFAAFLTLVAFAIDIALYAYASNQLADLDGISSHTLTGPGKALIQPPI